MTAPAFPEFPKIARLSRPMIVTEKIDGTNGLLFIGDDGAFHVGSRSRWLTPDTGDNYGFLQWATAHQEELRQLGPGSHYGEWWGRGIQRGYGVPDKRFSLFNVARWGDDRDRATYPETRPACCSVVPTLAVAPLFDMLPVAEALTALVLHGSHAAPGFMQPEGVVIFHVAGNVLFKKTILKDEEWKGRVSAARASADAAE